MLKCRDILAYADRLLAGDLKWYERLSLRLHFAMCHQCKRVVDQYRAIVERLSTLETPASENEVAAVMAGIDRAATAKDTPEKQK